MVADVQNFIEAYTRSMLKDYDRWLRRELAKYGIVIPEDATPDELQRLAREYRFEQFDVGFETRFSVSDDTVGPDETAFDLADIKAKKN